ncbi:MAG: hypothetical protein MMC23_006346 [Stictis urceolatum]|nr:hypothetical protein [Stictis urceolata]
MHFAVGLVALFAAVNASPYPAPQGVTSIIAPPGAAPSGCVVSRKDKFGINIIPISPSAVKRSGNGNDPVCDGQPQHHTASQIVDGQVQAPTDCPSPSDPPPPKTDKTVTETPPPNPASGAEDGQVFVASRTLELKHTSTPATLVAALNGQVDINLEARANEVSDLQSLNETSEAGLKCTAEMLVLTLNDGIMKDAHGRTAYIASNYQFQFDNPPQHGAITTAGYSLCPHEDGTFNIALGRSEVFYRCSSGSFYNLYDRNWAPQCDPVHFQVLQFASCNI